MPPRATLQPEPTSRAAAKSPEWIAGPTGLKIGNMRITADMVYVGPSERYAHPPNNALIDPALSIGFTGDPTGATLSYWSDYSQIDPRARRTYLEWLDGGRRDPTTPIGYVFLFFYGLERRLIYDKAYGEAERIVAEVQHLLDIYGSNYSFRGYAGKLLEVGDLMRDVHVPVETSLALASNYELPLGVRVRLGKRLRADEALDADDALCWAIARPDIYLRTPASRCFEELQALWAVRFAERFPDGLKVKTPKARISHVYRAASGNFSADISINDLPDIAVVSAPVAKLNDLLSSCTEELDPLSRMLGRSPDARGSLAAAALAPAPLRQMAGGSALEACLAEIASHLEEEETRLVPVTAMLNLLQLDAPATGKMAVPLQRQMATLLELLDYGFEPDRRYGAAAPLSCDGKMALFRSIGGGKLIPDRPEFLAARTMVDVAALAALADGVVVPVELESIAKDLAAVPGLDEIDRLRLLARAKVVLEDPPKWREALKRLGELPEEARRRVTRSAVSAVLADGRITPAEVKFLEGLHEALGLPKDDVYVALHRHAVADDDPITVSQGELGAGIAIPQDPTGAAVAIDEARLARIRSETLAVSEMLAGIFAEDQPAMEKPAPVAPVEARFAGLDARHADLLWEIVSSPLARSVFEERAREIGLLPDGAIETINEWGFDTFDEPALEDGELVYIGEHLLPRLHEMGVRT